MPPPSGWLLHSFCPPPMQWCLSLGSRMCQLGRAFYSLLFSAPWSEVGLCVNNHLLHIKISLKRLIYGYDNISLRVDLILCPFGRVIVVGFPLAPMTCLDIGYQSYNGAIYGFHLVEEILNPIREWLVAPMMFIPFTTGPEGTPCQTSHDCSSMDPDWV